MSNTLSNFGTNSCRNLDELIVSAPLPIYQITTAHLLHMCLVQYCSFFIESHDHWKLNAHCKLFCPVINTTNEQSTENTSMGKKHLCIEVSLTPL